MKKSQLIKITVKFEFTKLTVEIPRTLFYNYFEVWGSTENAMKVEEYRTYGRFNDPPTLVRKFYNLNKNRFQMHDDIFSSVGVGHQYGDNAKVEYYIQHAIEHWLKQMEENKKEPVEYLITEVRRARASPKVEVLKYARRIKKK